MEPQTYQCPCHALGEVIAILVIVTLLVALVAFILDIRQERRRLDSQKPSITTPKPLDHP